MPRTRVTGRLVSTEYKQMGGSLDRAIVSVLRGSTGFNRFVDPETGYSVRRSGEVSTYYTPDGEVVNDPATLPPMVRAVDCTEPLPW